MYAYVTAFPSKFLNISGNVRAISYVRTAGACYQSGRALAIKVGRLHGYRLGCTATAQPVAVRPSP